MITKLELLYAKGYARSNKPTLYHKNKLIEYFMRDHEIKATMSHVLDLSESDRDRLYLEARDFFRKQIEQDETILNSQKELRNEDGQSDN